MPKRGFPKRVHYMSWRRPDDPPGKIRKEYRWVDEKGEPCAPPGGPSKAYLALQSRAEARKAGEARKTHQSPPDRRETADLFSRQPPKSES